MHSFFSGQIAKNAIANCSYFHVLPSVKLLEELVKFRSAHIPDHILFSKDFLITELCYFSQLMCL